MTSWIGGGCDGSESGRDEISRTHSAPILAREREVAKTAAINALLTRPIGILPAKVGDPASPFALGLWNDVRPLLKPEVSVSALRA